MKHTMLEDLQSVATFVVINVDGDAKYQLILQPYHVDIYRNATGLIVDRIAWAEINSVRFDHDQVRFHLQTPNNKQKWLTFVFSCLADAQHCEFWLKHKQIVTPVHRNFLERVICRKQSKYKPLLE